jgi:hypothetical protein
MEPPNNPRTVVMTVLWEGSWTDPRWAFHIHGKGWYDADTMHWMFDDKEDVWWCEVPPSLAQ